MHINTNKNFLTNLVTIIFGQAGNLVLNFISISLTARYLGVDNFGLFNSLLSISILVSKFSDLGISQITFREYCHATSKFQIINTAISIRTITFFTFIIPLNLFLVFFLNDLVSVLLINLLLINVFLSSKFQNIRELFDIPFKQSLTMIIPSIIIFIDNLIFLIMVVLFPIVGGGLNYIIIAYVISNLPGFLILLFYLKKNFGYSFRFEFYNWKWLIKEAAPLYGYLILFAFFQQSDVLLLKFLDSDYSAGLYSVALRLTIPFGIIPFALITTIYPTFVTRVKEKMDFNIVINLTYKVLILLAISISILFLFKSTEIISLIFGADYSKASIPTVILFFSQIFLFFNYFSVDVFTVFGFQKYSLKYGIIIVVLNTILILILLPTFSVIGVAISKFLATMFGSFLMIFLLKNIPVQKYFFNLRSIYWIVSVLIACFISSIFHLFIYLPLSIIIVLFLILSFKIFSRDEINIFLKIINREKWNNKILKMLNYQ